MPSPLHDDPAALAGQLRALLGHLQRSGIADLPRPDAAATERLAGALRIDPAPSAAAAGEAATHPAAGPPRRAAAPPPVDAGPSSPPATAAPQDRRAAPPEPPGQGGAYPTEPLPVADRQRALAALADQVAGCTRCEQLACTRRQTVFGEGNPTPRICFFGEAPGADEDRQGRPFVGRAGQLLTKIIEACTFRREDVFILNALKCRPPGNRNPTDAEVANCREYFTSQLEILQPEYIVCLGVVAARSLLGTNQSVGRLRGRLHRHLGSKVLVTYHPAYLLRNPAAKRATWDDLQLMMRDMGIRPPKKR